MPEAVTNELIYEVLKKLQQGVAKIDTKLDDHTHQFIGLREQMHTIEGNFPTSGTTNDYVGNES